MSADARTPEEVETEIQQCIEKMHHNVNNKEKLAFWEGKLAALRWIRGRD